MVTRNRSENGFITVQTLVVIVVIMATTLALTQISAGSRNVARQSEDLSDARRTADYGSSLIENLFSSDPHVRAPFGSNGVSSRHATLNGGKGSLLQWNQDGGNDQFYWRTDHVDKTVVITTETENAYTVNELPMRGMLIAESIVNNGEFSYRIPAGPRLRKSPEVNAEGNYGLWGAPVSTWTKGGVFGSHINGSVTATVNGATKPGTWNLLGNAETTYVSGATKPRYVILNDDAVAPTGQPTSRSNMTASVDKSIANQLFAQVVEDGCSGTSAPASLTTGSGYVCSNGDLTINGFSAGPTTVRNIVVNGDLTIKGNITPPGNGQVHIYVSGNVKFETPSNASGSVLALNNTFIFAPNGRCSTPSNAALIAVQMTGSLACESVGLGGWSMAPSHHNNTVRWVAPMSYAPTAPYTGLSRATQINNSWPRSVYYFESPTFTDQWSK